MYLKSMEIRKKRKIDRGMEGVQEELTKCTQGDFSAKGKKQKE